MRAFPIHLQRDAPLCGWTQVRAGIRFELLWLAEPSKLRLDMQEGTTSTRGYEAHRPKLELILVLLQQENLSNPSLIR
jgi:hypothetical protein